MNKGMNRRNFMKVAAAGMATIAFGNGAELRASTRPPNILFIMADDCTHNVLGCYGGKNAKTPNIDKLASQGVKFNYAYVAMSMCAPCRHELYTGLYPQNNGAAWNHSAAKPGTLSVCHYLGEMSYRVGIAGKIHVKPDDSFPFELVDGFERGCVKPTADYDTGPITEFMAFEDPLRPFCLFVNSINPHAPWTVGDASKFDQGKIKLPPVFADTKQIRKDYADYLAEVEQLDREVGDILKALQRSGKANNTIVFFSSEQGWQFSGAKWTNWDIGLHTALLAKWPNHVEPGTETDALVQFADIVPTMIEIAVGDHVTKDLDGSSFLPVLLGQKRTHRRYVYGLHNNVPEGPPYPIRTIRDKKFRYIMNLTPEAQYIEKHIEDEKWGLWWTSWKEKAKTDANAKRLLERFYHRPAEELYLPNEDPYELNNLADDPKYAADKQRLKTELLHWMKEQNDPGAAMDTEEALQANRKAVGWGQKKK